MSLLWATLAIFVTVMLVSLLKHWRKSRRWSHFPGFSALTSLPMVGHVYLADLKLSPMQGLAKYQRDFGDIFRCAKQQPS